MSHLPRWAEGLGRDSLLERLVDAVDALDYHDRATLREQVTFLKQAGAESWAVGEMLSRVCDTLDELGMPKVGPWASAASDSPAPLQLALFAAEEPALCGFRHSDVCEGR